VDGNKRTAFQGAALFLLRNGLWLTATNEAATETMLKLAAGELTEEAFALWLNGNSQKQV